MTNAELVTRYYEKYRAAKKAAWDAYPEPEPKREGFAALVETLAEPYQFAEQREEHIRQALGHEYEAARAAWVFLTEVGTMTVAR